MSRTAHPGHRLLAGALCASLAWPGHAAPLTFSQMPIALATPPAPNVFVTLDDSGSMAIQVNYVAGQEYPIPPGPDGNPIVAMPPAPQTYNDGYVNSPAPVNLTGAFLTAYNGLPAAQRPAYLRWFAFYRDRTRAMKAGVMRTFHTQKIPDGRIRLAWQGIWTTCAAGFPSAGCNNAMWPLSDSEGGRTHRTNFYNWVRAVPAPGGTPLRAAYERVGQYLMTTGVNSPWAHLPGQTQLPEVSCRRSFQLMFTDGGWNGAGPDAERDNVSTTLPDGTPYTARGPYAHNWSGTLADVAFRYWATDLQTGANFGNDVVPVMRVPGNQTFAGASVAPYWNPNNNPATWQHLTTFAIAFGEAANITNPLWSGSTTAGTQFAEIVAGTRQWPIQAAPDLWHAAVNSRGAMYLATDQASLDAAFTEVMGEIAAQTIASGGAASSYSVQGTGFRVVRAGFLSSPNLRGSLGGFSLNSAGVLQATPDWEGNTTLAAVAHGSRVVMTASGPTGGAAFRWNGLSTWQQGQLNQPPIGAADTQGGARLDYLRGDTSNEATNLNPTAAFRWRQGGLLGTIVNSEPKVVAVPRSGYTFRSYQSFRSGNTSRTSVAYLGTNDGMLHGFNAASGAPVLSYVPRGVYPFLSAYADKAHVHRMYVDGPLITADWDSAATSPTPAWRTLLIGGLRAGGRGFFVLDVTNPANFTEANAASIVRFDYTAPPVGHASLSGFITESGSTGMMGEIATDLGHLTADPSRDAYLGRNLQVTRMKNGKWALLLGNGVNSVNERAVLYVFYLDGSGFKKLVTAAATGQGNGLATPLPVDVDNDGLVDYAYAGDLLGRIWKFDLSSTDDEQWKVVQVDNVNTPLIDVGRPITSAPAVAQHPRGGLLVTFGTGRLLTDDDRSSSTTEYLYGVWDKPGGPFPAATSSLVTRTLAADTATTPGGSIAARVLSTTSTAVDYSTKRGWRIALGLSRERVIYNPLVQGTIAYYSTYIPSVAVSSCSVQDAGGSLLTFDVINGGEPASTVVDINGDGAFTSADRIAGKDVMGRGVGVGRFIGLFEAPPGSGTNASCAGDLIMGASGMICARKPPGPGRRAWRDMRP
ncbi:MAG: pilus assembly protein [Rubrivivax sp.]